MLTIKTSVWINLSIPYFTNQPIYYIVSLIINTIMLGATVDYAILFTTRYMQERRSMRRMDAIAASIAGTTSAIMTSASIMAVGGLSLGLVSSVEIVGQLGVLVGRGALISMAMVLLVLPALLIIFDPLIRILTVRAHFYRKRKDSHDKSNCDEISYPLDDSDDDGAAPSGAGGGEERGRLREPERDGGGRRR